MRINVFTGGRRVRRDCIGEQRSLQQSEACHSGTTKSAVSKTAAGDAIQAVLDVITRTLSEGDTVQLVGFGSFSQGQRAARTGRNLTTGAEIAIAAATTVKFGAGKAFRDAVNTP
ncbi:HU family DNA-binding protein [Burkholderia sp. Bp9002]|nr:HU family DNA-binding protein [Burkholderia sp. Bp9002]